MQKPVVIHQHRKPKKKDFEGKTIKRVKLAADNHWVLYFTDGTSFAIQSELHHGFAVMDICDTCT